ncbi:MAG: DUF3336 domain-containing protein, partial [Pseudomonadales bacterium]|nr:DUF3336 domain-containing protein [Pseudomonadales bacterium]
IHGNMGGMGKPLLYEAALSGTKQLIVDYVNEIASALELLASPEVDNISFEDKLDFFRRAHHCFGSSAFMMSGSGNLMYFHVGVVKALREQNLLPGIVSGASGGAIVGSILCTHSDQELVEKLGNDFLSQEIELAGKAYEASGGRKRGVFLAQEVEENLARVIPDMTFQEAYEHTGRMLNISVAAAEKHQTSRLLSATTSPNVLIRKAVMASAAVPGVFAPVMLEARNKEGESQPYLPSRQWVDGSVSDDLPAKRLARLYGVNHYIVSQANPMVLPFITESKNQRSIRAVLTNTARQTYREWLNASATIFHKPLSKNSVLARAANNFISVVNQDYTGDINILPRNRFYNPFKLLGRMSAEEALSLVAAGERSAWRKIEMIRVQTRIGKVLDKILRSYNDQLVRDHNQQRVG